MKILLNGRPCQPDGLYNRGLLYGDGLFTTLAVHATRPLLAELHRARLERGCRRLGLCFPGHAVLEQELQQACQGLQQGVLRLQLCRASEASGGGYRPPPGAETIRILSVHPWRSPATTGAILRLCRVRLAHQPFLAGIKHLNRLEQVLAAAECLEPDIDEGLMLDEQGYMVEGTHSNLFLIEGRCLYTPPLYGCGVAGVMREAIFASASRLQLLPVVTPLLPARLYTADEVFISNSLIGVRPVLKVDGRICRQGEHWSRLRQALVASNAVVPA